ncbi:MAG: antitoxin, RHH family protein [Elusimicrobia bacterium]|nr:antitoxin, RHH family protein [Elusimicrobiota bacterium]
MPTKNPRINVVLKKPLFTTIKSLANRNKVSLSSQVEVLLTEALETLEDVGLSKIADRRNHSFDRKTALSHERFWKAVNTARIH